MIKNPHRPLKASFGGRHFLGIGRSLLERKECLGNLHRPERRKKTRLLGKQQAFG